MTDSKPETIAKKDVTYIRKKFSEEPTWNTIKSFARKYSVPEGRILSYLGKLADPIRESRRELQREAIQRHREKRQQKRWDKKLSRAYGEQKLPDKTVIWFRLIPVDPTTFERRTGTITEKNYSALVKMNIHFQNVNTIRMTELVKKMSHDYKYISKWAKKHGYPVTLIDNYSRVREPSRLSSPIRGTRSCNDFVIQVSGKSKRGRFTSGSGRVKIINDKPFLLIRRDIAFEIYAHDDSPDDKYYNELKRRIQNGESWFVTILDHRKRGKGFQAIFPHIREIPEFNYSGQIYVVIRPEVKMTRGFYNVYIFVDEVQVKHLTFSFPFGRIKNQASERRKGIIRSFIQKAIREIWLKIKEYSQLQPYIIYIDKIDDGSNRDISNWLSETRMYFKLRDKLAWVRGKMLRIDIGEPQDLNSCLTRLSI